MQDNTSSPDPQEPQQGSVLGRFFRRLFSALGRILVFVFGRPKLSYQVPQWINPGLPHLFGQIRQGLAAAAIKGRKEKKGKLVGAIADQAETANPGAEAIAPRVQARWVKPARIAALALGAALLVFGGLWVFQDRSDWIKLSVETPDPTPLEKGAHYSVLGIKFSGSAARIDLADKTVGEGITLLPATKGSWKWVGDDELVFSPSEDWIANTGYSVKMQPSIFREGIKLYSHDAGFSTEAFSARLDDARFEVDPRNDQDRRIRATVVLNYPVEIESLKNQVELKVTDNKVLGTLRTIPVELAFDEFLGQVYVKSDPLPVPTERVSVELVVRGGIRTKSGGASLGSDLKQTVSVPGLYDKVSYEELNPAVVRNENYEYEQILNLQLSGEVVPDKVAKVAAIWLLPKDRVGIAGYEDEKDHQWNAVEVDKSLLAKGQKLDFKLLPTENDTATLLSFKYKAPAGRMVYAEFAGKVEAFGGYIIKEALRATVQVPEVPKSLEIMHSGSILSLSGEKTISVVSNDVSSVRFRASRLFPDQVNHLITQTGGSFGEPYFRNEYAFSELDMSTVYSELRDLAVQEPGTVQYQAFDFTRYLEKAATSQERYGLFLFNVSEYNKETKSEFGESSRRFILITDLGMLAKRNADQSYEIFVQDIRSGQPRAAATVEVLGRNGVSVFSGATDGNGRVHVPKLASFNNEKQPVVFTAQSNGDMSFLPLNRQDRFLEYSRFDVGGEHGAADPGKVTAFLFSDRGLYRPGDRINVGYIVKAGDWAKSLAGLPLELKIFDPRGVEVQKTQVKLPSSGFDEMNYKTFDTSTTGTWRFELALIRDDKSRQFLGNVAVRVEEFVPDRLTISSRIENATDRAWVPFAALKAKVHLMNLYGMPATGNEIKGAFRLAPRAISFPKFDEYRFDDAFETDKYYEETLASAQTDEKGDAGFEIDLSKFEPATFQLTFTAEGLEKQGGRGVTSESSVIVSPLEWIAGWKVDGRLDYIAKGGTRTVGLVAIDSLQKAVSIKDLQFALDEIRYVSVLTKQEDDSYQYQSVRKKNRVNTGAFAIPAAGLEYALDTANPGDFEFVVMDKAERIVAKIAYSVIGKGNLSRTLDRNAELQIKLDKADYEVGDQIELQIKAPYAGSGLITIERDKVYASQWFTTDSNASIQHITVPEGLEGSAYINVSFVRAIDSRDIYMSPLSYGVEPFRVSIAKRAIALTLDCPAEAKPGRPYVIKYKADRPSKIVIFAVDEGILQLARYQTPQPLPFFFKKRALEVSTSQILDMILPEFSIVKELMSAGGDADALRNRQNPFKRKSHEPVAYWSGIIDAGPEERSVSYTIPSYFNGTMRVMALAVSDDAIGVSEKKALIRNDFIITPTLPLFVAPGDEFLMGVTVANNAKLADANPIITLQIKAQDGLTLVGAAKQELRLARNTEGTVWFRLKAGSLPGAARVNFVASSGGLSSDLVEELSIRPAISWREDIQSGILKNGETQLKLARQLLPDLRKLQLSLSFKPAALSSGLLGYLADYPYGCSEQIISQSFPAMILMDDPASKVDKAKTEKSISQAIKILASRQNEDGGIGLWAANTVVDDFVTVYATQFLTEAATRGYKAGESVRLAALDYLADTIARDTTLLENQPQVGAYAAWVLALNGKVSTNLVLDVRKILEKKGGNWRQDPAVLYLAGAYSLLKQQAECDKLLADYGNGRSLDNQDFYYDSGLYRLGLQVYMNARYRSGNPLADNNQILENMVGFISQNGFSTMSSSWAVLAFRAYGERAPQVSADRVQAIGITRDGKEKPITITAAGVLTTDFAADLVSIKVKDSAGLPLYWQTVQSGFDAALPTKPEMAGLEIFREYQDEKGAVVTVAKRGQQLSAVVKIRSSGKAAVGNVAVVDLLPGGFEMALDQQGNRPFNELVQGTMVREYGEAREDRIIMFGQAGTKLTEFRYPVKAVTAGTFVLPVGSVEAMYDRTIRAQTVAGSFTVTE